MEFTDTQWELFDFVKSRHTNQEKEPAREPFFTFLLRVVEILSEYELNNGEKEIGLCHALLEKTTCTKQELIQVLKGLGYGMFERNEILKGVIDLTEKYTAADYPDMEAGQRKIMENERVVDTEPFSQTVRYAVIIENIDILMVHDQHGALRYLQEVLEYIGDIDQGNKILYNRCRKICEEAFVNLSDGDQADSEKYGFATGPE